MAKATVQAALGPVCLRKLSHIEDATDEQKHYADIVMMICIFSIVLTAPIGAILISISGPRLLTKTKTLPPTEGKFPAISWQHFADSHCVKRIGIFDFVICISPFWFDTR